MAPAPLFGYCARRSPGGKDQHLERGRARERNRHRNSTHAGFLAHSPAALHSAQNSLRSVQSGPALAIAAAAAVEASCAPDSAWAGGVVTGPVLVVTALPILTSSSPAQTRGWSSKVGALISDVVPNSAAPGGNGRRSPAEGWAARSEQQRPRRGGVRLEGDPPLATPSCASPHSLHVPTSLPLPTRAIVGYLHLRVELLQRQHADPNTRGLMCRAAAQHRSARATAQGHRAGAQLMAPVAHMRGREGRRLVAWKAGEREGG